MEPTVRSARLESAIGWEAAQARLSANDSRVPAGQFRPEIQSPGTEFLDAETRGQKSTRKTVMSAETGNIENSSQDPRRNGLFSIDNGFRGSGRLDGGVRSRMRTSLRQETGV